MIGRWLVITSFAGLSACSSAPHHQQAVHQPSDTQKVTCDCSSAQPNNSNLEPSKPLIEQPTEQQSKLADYGLLKPAKWEDIDYFTSDDFTQAWPAWLQGCSTLKNKPAWQNVCNEALRIKDQKKWTIITYFKKYFLPYSANNPDGTNTGLITGYYEPMLKGSKTKVGAYQYPIYTKPKDLITVELGNLYPELANKRVRGRLIGDRLVAYYPRAEIETTPSPIAGNELVWLSDPIDVFFLHIQGSGLIQLENGEKVHVGYADQNGQAYNSIGKLLIQQGELTADKASMQGIKNWAYSNPAKLRSLLNANPSYVFFRELPAGLSGPLGALGVPILSERVVAIDPKFIPLGAPIFLQTTMPNSTIPLNRLMMAQDTGGAIKGGVRADFFWGSDEIAAQQAGAMKQSGKIWVLLPKEFSLPN